MLPAPPAVRHADARDHDAVVRVLVRAFEDDPAINYLLRQDASRGRAFDLAFGAFFRHMTLPFGETYLEAEGRGAALWTPPGCWNVRLPSALAMTPAIVRAVGLSRIVKVVRAATAVHNAHPTEPHYYLFAIGVDPVSQGRGIGSALLRQVLTRCDAERASAYLEASKPENARLYARHGFRTVEELKMAPDSPPIWRMWRDPMPPR